MIREKKLGSGIYFSAEELIPAALLILCAFLKTVSVIITDTGATVLFLTESVLADGIDHLLHIPFAIAVMLMIIWPVLSVIKEKSTYVPAYLLTALGGISVLLYGLSFLTESWIFGCFLMIWKYAFCVLSEVAFWLIAFRFGIFGKKSKTLPYVLGATFLGWITGGVLCGMFSETPALMLLLSAILILIAATVLKTLADNGSVPILYRFTFDKEKIKQQGYDSSQKKLFLSFYAVSALIFFALGIYQINFFLKISFLVVLSDGNTTANYNHLLGFTYICTIIPTILVFIWNKNRKNPNLLAGLYLIPVVFFILFLSVFSPIRIILAQSLFILAVFTKEVALQAIPWAVSPRTGFRATLLRKSVVEPIALIAGGVFLIMVRNTSAIMEQYINLYIAVIVLAAIFILRRFYLALVLNMLNSHLWRGGRLLLAGKAINNWLKENLESKDSQNVLYALRVIEESKNGYFSHYLEQALRHSNEEVRLYALSKIEELKQTDLLPQIDSLIQNDPSPAVRQNAIRVMCCLGTAEDREYAVLQIEDPILREGALTGLLAIGQEGVFTAIKCVADLAVSDKRKDRLTAANVLGNAGNPAFYQPLENLLADADPEICRAALNAAGKLANPVLLPEIMQLFRYPDLREDASNTLLQFKEAAFSEIDSVLHSDNYPVQFRILLTRLVARIASPAAEEFLFDHIQIEDRRIRFNIIKALALSGYKATGKKVNIIRLCLYDEMETATGILAAIHTFSKNRQEDLNASLALLISALNTEIEYIKERILLLLDLIYPSKALTDFLNKYNPASPQDEQAVKITDKLLSGELRTLCMPLFENKTLQQRLALLRPQFYPSVLPPAGHVRDILKTPAGELTDWTRACAAYTAAYMKDISFVDDLIVLSDDADAIVRETAVWALGRILPREEAARLVDVRLEDSVDYVARMARFVVDGMGQTSF